MQLLEQTEIKLEWFDLNKLHEHPYPKHKRSKGLHLSDILRKIAIKNNVLKDEDRADEVPLRVFIGMAWEQACVRLYPEIRWQPEELTRDGVAGSPDGFSYNILHGTALLGDEGIIEEFKFTAKSLRKKGSTPDDLKDIRDEWLWMQQVMGYCNMHPGRLTLARLHVCWECGNYVYPLQERYIRYLIRFEPRELEGNWKMVVKNRYK
jgi:hypothetical protein